MDLQTVDRTFNIMELLYLSESLWNNRNILLQSGH